MEKNEMKNIINNGDESVLCTDIFQESQRLTPTGKISRAKTRVYTQRYRKEWEQMPDFKGWLTSSIGEPTRAFCTYCKKSLHAHRLSLLKHTCTMKHQRAALMHQAEMNDNKLNDGHGVGKLISDFNTQFVGVNVQSLKVNCSDDDEDGGHDFDYVVERLEMEDEENLELRNEDVDGERDDDDDDNDDEDDDENHCDDEDDNDDDDEGDGDDDDDENNDEDDDEEGNEKNNIIQTEDETFQLKIVYNNNEDMSDNKKLKLDNSEHRDTLAEAMAHVHGEYLDNDDDSQNQELNTTVEPENSELSNKNSNHSNNNVVNHENDTTDIEISGDEKKTLENCSIDDESAKFVAYQINSPQLSLASGQQNSGATLTIAPIHNKTIRLSTGKTVTLTTGKLPAGYILSKVKKNLPTFVMASKNKVINQRAILPKSQPTLIPSPSQSQIELSNCNIVAGPSENVSKKIKVAKNIISITPARISTHVLDMSKGLPIGGLQVSLYKLLDGRWTFLNESTTSPSGRCTDLVDMKKSQITAGRYKIHFDVGKYFTLRKIETMYPFIEVVFDVKNPTGNYHIPILLSPFSYTTYHGTDR